MVHTEKCSEVNEALLPRDNHYHLCLPLLKQDCFPGKQQLSHILFQGLFVWGEEVICESHVYVNCVYEKTHHEF